MGAFHVLRHGFKFYVKTMAKLDALLGKVEAALERLREHRSAFITAAVTGKFDVRGAVPVAE